MKRSTIEKRMAAGRERLQPALRLLVDLRAGIVLGEHPSDLLNLCDELTSELLRVEDAVGVLTPAALFDTDPAA